MRAAGLDVHARATVCCYRTWILDRPAAELPCVVRSWRMPIRWLLFSGGAARASSAARDCRSFHGGPLACGMLPKLLPSCRTLATQCYPDIPLGSVLPTMSTEAFRSPRPTSGAQKIAGLTNCAKSQIGNV